MRIIFISLLIFLICSLKILPGDFNKIITNQNNGSSIAVQKNSIYYGIISQNLIGTVNGSKHAEQGFLYVLKQIKKIKTLDVESNASYQNDIKVLPSNTVSDYAEIKFTVQKQGLISLYLTDMLGKSTYVFDGKFLEAGEYSASIDLSQNTNGIYIISLMQKNSISSEKILIVK